jgi:hypothetical protein
MTIRAPQNAWNFLNSWGPVRFSRRTLLHGVSYFEGNKLRFERAWSKLSRPHDESEWLTWYVQDEEGGKPHPRYHGWLVFDTIATGGERRKPQRKYPRITNVQFRLPVRKCWWHCGHCILVCSHSSTLKRFQENQYVALLCIMINTALRGGIADGLIFTEDTPLVI